MNRDTMLTWAEAIDRYRVFPRLFLIACFLWVVSLTDYLLTWYVHLAKDERGIEASGFASIALLAALGFLKLVYQTYSDAGQSWGTPATTSQTTVTSATTTVQP